MDENGRQTVRTEQMAELYQTIGECVVAFEHVSWHVRRCIVFLLESAGLTQQPLAFVVSDGLTAGRLRELLFALVTNATRLDDDEKQIVFELLKRYGELTKRRNEVIHSVWGVGGGDRHTTDFSTARGHAERLHKSELVFMTREYTAKDFKEIASEARKLGNLFAWLEAVIGRCVSFSEVFQMGPDNTISLQPHCIG